MTAAHPLWTLEEVIAFAILAHGEQKRGGTLPLDYVSHPIAVSRWFQKLFPDASPEALAIALLHDVVEDTLVTLAEIRERFGDKVADGVDVLTTPPKKADEPKWTLEEKTDYQLAKIKTASNDTLINENILVDAKIIKILDQMHNIASSVLDPRENDSFERRLAYLGKARALARAAFTILPEEKKSPLAAAYWQIDTAVENILHLDVQRATLADKSLINSCATERENAISAFKKMLNEQFGGFVFESSQAISSAHQTA
jgi:hypothetical protein